MDKYICPFRYFGIKFLKKKDKSKGIGGSEFFIVSLWSQHDESQNGDILNLPGYIERNDLGIYLMG